MVSMVTKVGEVEEKTGRGNLYTYPFSNGFKELGGPHELEALTGPGRALLSGN